MIALKAGLRVVFAHRAAHSSMGSKLMRSDQLCALARRHLGDKHDFEVMTLPRPGQGRKIRRLTDRLRDAVVILLKRADWNFDAEEKDQLRKAARGVCIDYVDAPIDGPGGDFADVHIAACRSGAQALSERWAGCAGVSVRLVTHHADPRIPPRMDLGDRRFRIGYFGDPRHLSLPVDMAGDVDLAWMTGEGRIERALRLMRRSPMHFAVREPSDTAGARSFKPFTKGFNAAMSNANILINKDAPEAKGYLGPDYPFFIESAKAEDIIEGCRRARDAFGAREWRDGLEQMGMLRKECAPARIAAQLDDVISIFA